MTIDRSWSARATSDGARAYLTYFRTILAPELERLPGYLRASIFERPHGEAVELTVITRWVSLDAIRAFAGEHYERAVVEPAARSLLIEFDDHVEHRTLVLELPA